MKKIIISFISFLFVVAAYAKDIQELTVTTNPPMSCQNCENKIKGNLRFEKGIKKIETDLPDQRVVIEYDADKTNPEKIEAAFKKIGYSVEVIKDNQPAKGDKNCSNCQKNCPANSQSNAPACCGGGNCKESAK